MSPLQSAARAQQILFRLFVFVFLLLYYDYRWSRLERFSNDCRKTKTKAITPANHNMSKQRDEPITILSNYL